MVESVYISVDFEGMEGVVSGRQLTEGTHEYSIACQRLTEDVNAAIEGAMDAGARKVVVCDGHGFGENILLDQLNPEAELISGPLCTSVQLQGIGPEFDAMVVFGHSGAGLSVDGVLNHSYSGKKVYNIRLNGTTMNTEAVLNAAEAGSHGVPLVTMIGDKAAVSEVRQHIPAVEGVVVKTGFTRNVAMSLHPEKARALIREGVARGLARRDEIPPLRLAPPIAMELDYMNSGFADVAELVPGVKRIGPRTVHYSGEPETVFRLLALLVLYVGG
jgi:D-amino peptidase